MSVIQSIFVIIFGFMVAAIFAGCSDDQVAPVVNAWYQQKAASNFYVVQEGDTIYSIAFAFGVDYQALAEVNNLQPPYVLTEGQRLKMVYHPAQKIEDTARPGMPDHTAPVEVATDNASPQTEPGAAISAWQWPAKGQIIQSFSHDATGRPGLSISGAVGEPVQAAANGVVVYSGDGVRGYGNLIIVKHNRTYLSAYAFNQKNLVSTGDRVHKGQEIALMGQNDAGRPLLYFEIRRNGVPINPLTVLM